MRGDLPINLIIIIIIAIIVLIVAVLLTVNLYKSGNQGLLSLGNLTNSSSLGTWKDH